MRFNQTEAAVHGCYSTGNLAVRMRKVLTKPNQPLDGKTKLIYLFFNFDKTLIPYLLYYTSNSKKKVNNCSITNRDTRRSSPKYVVLLNHSKVTTLPYGVLDLVLCGLTLRAPSSFHVALSLLNLPDV